MPLKRIDYIIEFFFCLLVLGATFSNAFVDSAIGFIVLFFLIKKFISREFKPPRTPLNILIYALFFIILISFFRSEYPKESLRGVIRIVKYALVYFAGFEIFSSDKGRVKRFFWVLISISLVTFLNGIFQGIFGFDLFRHKGFISDEAIRRLSASFVHPNDFGGYIILVLPLALAFLFPLKSKRQRIFLAVVFLLGTYCLLRTYSRGALFGFFIGLAAYLYFYNRKSCILLPVVFLLFMAASPKGVNRVKNMFIIEKNTVWERTQLWRGALSMIKERPIAGMGINTYSNYFPMYKPKDYPDLRYAHNSYLQIWAEIGIIGLLAYLGLIFSLLITVLKGIRQRLESGLPAYILLGAACGYIAFLIQAAFDTNLHSLVLVTYFWIFNAYIISLKKGLE